MASINGAIGNQTLVGTADGDTISGLDGHDTIAGGPGNDVIYGHSAVDIEPLSGVIEATRVSSQPGPTISMAIAPGDPGHLYFLTQLSGVISAFDLNTGTNTTFLDIDNTTFSSGGERGALSIAFHPDYATNGRLYVNLTRPNGDVEVREYTRSPGNPLQADPASARTIITIPHSDFANHNGGQLLFGPNDGLLYLSVGDGGSGGDPNNNAQNVDSLLGKILRLDVNGDDFPADDARNYHIPPSNPFVGRNGADEIWALGLRNPFRMSFDTNGDLYIGDVGQSAREEIDFQPDGLGGVNYGWRIREGLIGFSPGTTPPPEAPLLTDPVFDYPRTIGTTVIGGVVNRGPTPGLQGGYIFSDIGSNRYFTLTMAGGTATAVVELTDRIVTGGNPLSIGASYGVDAQGQVYHVSLNGAVHRLSFSAAAGDGNDTIGGGPGSDTIWGGAGNDVISGDDDADVLYGGLGSDQLNGAAGDDWIEGGSGVDWLTGSSGDDRLEGQDGNDTLDGQGGRDAMVGGRGDDAYFVDNALDSVFENAGEGNDTVLATISFALPFGVETLVLGGGAAIDGSGNAEANILLGNGAANLLRGFGGSDWIEGRGGADWLSGGDGADRLDGGDGVDALEGQRGADTLLGGAGGDFFYYGSFHDSNAIEGIDTIWDFEAGIDKINLGDARVSANDRVTLIVAGSNTYVNVDLLGDGTQDMVIEVGGTSIAMGDILI